MDNIIKLKENNIIRFNIVTSDGEQTGEYIEFDLEDISLPIKLNKCDIEHSKNVEWLKMQLQIIDNREDKKGKYLLSYNEEEKIRKIAEFYEKEEKALDLFLGKGGTKKLLNGRNPYVTMYDDINDMLEPILPKLEINANSIIDKIKEKYKNDSKEEL